ncbi:hypothetical protein AAC387_Pa05g3316 [Persea americana]
MERKSEKVRMEQQKKYEHLRYDSMETKSDGIGQAGQRFLQEPSSSIYTVVRPPEYVSSGVKPVLNYSIQTGEEFAFEFMRDRVNPRKQFVPSEAGDQTSAARYMDLKGFLGVSHTGSESGSDVSMLATGEKGHVKESMKKGSSESENKSSYESTQSVQHATSGEASRQGFSHDYISSGTSNRSSTSMKILCSFGGKILPRPSDGTLRYAGGDTRIIRIGKNICWRELLQKTSKIYDEPHIIKYQLPGEDLDALVSVSCDEDLQNMMEECNLLRGGEGSQKLRMFLFSTSESDDSHFGLGSVEGDSEILQYVVAINGMDLGSRKDSSGHGLESTSANDLDQLFSLNIGGKGQTSGIQLDLNGSRTAPLTGTPLPISNTPSNPIQGSSVNGNETHVLTYQNRMTNHMEHENYPFSTVQLLDNFNDAHGRTSVPSSTPLQYKCISKYAPSVESSLPMPQPELMSLRQGGLIEAPRSGFRVQDQEVLPVEEVKLNADGLIQQNNEDEHFSHAQKYGGSVPNHLPVEVPFASSVPSQQNEKLQEPLQGSTPTNALNPTQTHDDNNDDHHYTSAGSSIPGFANSEGDPIHPTDFSYYEPPLYPQRVFHSERIPREQAESQSRLSKSDDNIGSQFPIPRSRSGLAPQEPITESVDPLNERSLSSHMEQSILSAKQPHANPLTVEDGLMQFEEYKELADALTQMNQHGPGEHLKVAQISKIKDHGREPCLDKANVGGPDIPSVGPGTATKPQEVHTSCASELQWGDMATKTTNNYSAAGQAPPFARAGSDAEVVPREESFVHDAVRGRGDILIDINDRFPPDLLSDIFSKARIVDDSTGMIPLHYDDAGLSLNMPNHEPKSWSFFRKLAPDEFNRNDVSLMDQDHLGFPSPLTKAEVGATGTYEFSPLKRERIGLGNVESQAGFDEEILQVSSGIVRFDTRVPQPDHIPSQVVTNPHLLDKGSKVVQVDDTSFSKQLGNARSPDSEYEGAKTEARHIGRPISDLSKCDFDISDLQIIKNEDLEELKELGSGTYGTVYHGKWRGTDVAIKRIKKSCFTGRSSEQERLTFEFWSEAEILSRLHHPNVVAFYGVVQDGPGGTLATVTEFMVNGSLRHVLLRKDKYLDLRKRLIIAMDAAFGMEYLHSKNIVHFDLKCDNLLVNLKDPMRPICKVGDFGLSKIKRNTLVTGGVRGTLPWMAPELLNGSSNKVSEKVDVFSFGIVMWEILTGEEPYANMHYGAIIGGIVNNTLRPPIPSLCDPEWRTLMELCWAPDPTVRPCFTEIAGRLRQMAMVTQDKSTGSSGSKSGN